MKIKYLIKSLIKHLLSPVCKLAGANFFRVAIFTPLLKRTYKKISFIFLLFPFTVWSQTTIFKETIGSYSGTISVTSYTGWSNGTTYTHTVPAGTVSLNSSVSSSNYSGASGGTPVRVSGSSTWIVSGINTSDYTSINLSFGIHKTNFRNFGENLNIEVSSDGTNYTTLTWTVLPSNSGTGDTWYYRAGGTDVSGEIPSATNLRIRIRNASSDPYDFDDLELKGSLVVPLHFIGFSIKKTGSSTEIKWQTANEQNVSHLEVQRSEDGASFTTIGQLPARNSGAEESYTFTDLVGGNQKFYYRIRSVDNDGKINISKILIVAPHYQQDLFVITNRSKYEIDVLSPANMEGKFQYELVNMNGVPVQRGEIMISGSRTTIALKTTIPPNLYIIKLSNANYQQQVKAVLR